MEKRKIGSTSLILIQGDITQQDTEVIVNAANSSLMGGGGVDGAIHRAGGPIILEECKEIIAEKGRLPTGQSVITNGGNLKAKYVIHTVGPVWSGGNKNEPQLLKNCYQNSLQLSMDRGYKTISFPSISTGVYSYPIDQASRIAIQAVVDFLNKNDFFEQVYFVLFDSTTFQNYRSALSEIVSD